MTLVPFPDGELSQTFQYFVRQSAHITDLPSVHEQGWCSADFELRAQGDGVLDPSDGFRFGGLRAGFLESLGMMGLDDTAFLEHAMLVRVSAARRFNRHPKSKTFERPFARRWR